MPEPGYAADGFFIRRVEAPGPPGIEVCGIDDVEPTDCKLFPEGTPEFAVAEKLLDLLEAQDPLTRNPVLD